MPVTMAIIKKPRDNKTGKDVEKREVLYIIDENENW